MPVNRSCHYCGKRFQTDDQRRLFCADKCRVAYHRQHKLVCFYCGEMATSKDHLFPQTFGNGKGDTVPACAECNSIMGHRNGCSVEQRVEYLYKRIVEKYQLNVQIPEWDDDELNELGYSLRKFVHGKINQRQIALERAIHVKARWREIKRLTK